eukprot:6828867-Pyramimonas_sp.AAC.1
MDRRAHRRNGVGKGPIYLYLFLKKLCRPVNILWFAVLFSLSSKVRFMIATGHDWEDELPSENKADSGQTPHKEVRSESAGNFDEYLRVTYFSLVILAHLRTRNVSTDLESCEEGTSTNTTWGRVVELELQRHDPSFGHGDGGLES